MKMLKIGITSLFAVSLILGLVLPAYSCQQCHVVPIGFEVVTDGKVYRWRSAIGTLSFDEPTKEKAIASAWSFVKYVEREENTKWRLAT